MWARGQLQPALLTALQATRHQSVRTSLLALFQGSRRGSSTTAMPARDADELGIDGCADAHGLPGGGAPVLVMRPHRRPSTSSFGALLLGDGMEGPARTGREVVGGARPRLVDPPAAARPDRGPEAVAHLRWAVANASNKTCGEDDLTTRGLDGIKQCREFNIRRLLGSHGLDDLVGYMLNRHQNGREVDLAFLVLLQNS
mmetsp:Transcript_135137/g.431916  ORF Transcript_135137/g.431916 Transcript_135137/m.431916 type:complete len:200 (+) Transcript_135137:933-1532(+)